jgi:oligopeptide/dipeptide ABC transporter ATP-binding protein
MLTPAGVPPPAWPAITTMLVLVFMWTWNEFLLALVMIQSDDLRTAPLDRARTGRTRLTGEIPSPLKKPSGCSFHPRCPIAKESCSTHVPPLETKESGQEAACPYT